MVPVVTIISFILSSSKIQNGNNTGTSLPRGYWKMAIKLAFRTFQGQKHKIPGFSWIQIINFQGLSTCNICKSNSFATLKARPNNTKAGCCAELTILVNVLKLITHQIKTVQTSDKAKHFNRCFSPRTFHGKTPELSALLHPVICKYFRGFPGIKAFSRNSLEILNLKTFHEFPGIC